MKKIIAMLILATLIAGCRKNRPEIPKEYIGNWKSNEVTYFGLNIFYYINIGSDGKGTYEKDGVFDDDKVSGEAYIADGILYIGKEQFIINEVPSSCETSQGTVWTMKVGGRKYKR